MYIAVSILIFIIALLLVLVILVQNPKGGLASNFSSSNQIMGVRKTTDFLEKATWTLGIALLVFSVVSSSLIGGTTEVVQQSSELSEDANNRITLSPNQAPPINNSIPTPNEEAGAGSNEGGEAPVEE